MSRTITIKTTHIEINPYNMGDCKPIEKEFSTWIRAEFRVNYIGCHYDEMTQTLYLPRGANVTKLKYFFPNYEVLEVPHNNFRYCNEFKVISSPRDSIQVDAINFLTCKKKFNINHVIPQLALNLDTGDGKTFCTISAISEYRLRTIIITHKTKLKEQWYDEFKTKSNIDINRVIDLTSANDVCILFEQKPENIVHDIFIVTHQTLANFAKVTGSWNNIDKLFRRLGIGIKVYDECHKFFHNSLMIDFHSNVYKNFYLTATFGRSDVGEESVYKKAYSDVARFGEETFKYDEKIKHINLVIINYNSRCTQLQAAMLRTKRGFSNYKFIKYVMTEENQTLINVFKRLLDKCEGIAGRTLVASPTIESTEFFAEIARKVTGREVSTYHSKLSDEDRANAFNADIICSTIKSVAEGDNIPKLRKIILLDVVGEILMDQFRGRLRVYEDGKDTYMFCPVDISIDDNKRIFDRSLPVFRKKCKNIRVINMLDL